MPGEHVAGDRVVEQATAHEVAEHAALHGMHEPLDFARAEAGGLMEAERTVIGLGEEAVDDDGWEWEI